MFKQIAAIIVLIFLGVTLYAFGKQMNLRQTGDEPKIVPQPVAYKDMIVIDSPLVGETVRSPLTVTGKARGNWYFEASFPVQVVDTNGTVLGQAPAQAQGEWMTSEYVPFKATIDFKAPTTPTSTIRVVFKKDNPSGLPQNDDFVAVEINYSR